MRVSGLFGAGMGLIVDLEDMLHRKLSVALCGGESLVAEQLLDRAQIGAFFEQMSAKGMAQSVRMHVGRESLGDGNLLDDAAYAARRETPAAPVDQKRRSVLVSLGQESLTRSQIACQRVLDRIAERDVALFFSFSANQDRLGTQPDIVEIDPGQLRIANAASIEQFQHQTIAFGKRS